MEKEVVVLCIHPGGPRMGGEGLQGSAAPIILMPPSLSTCLPVDLPS